MIGREKYLHRIRLLRVRPTDRRNPLRPQRLRMQYPKMPQAPQSHNAHSLPGAAPVPLQRRVHRYPPAQYRRVVLTRDSVGDLEDEVRWHASIVHIAAHELATVGVFGAVRTDYLDAVLFLPIEAVLAVKAGGSLGANADAVADPAADSQRGHSGVCWSHALDVFLCPLAYLHCMADDFVPVGC